MKYALVRFRCTLLRHIFHFRLHVAIPLQTIPAQWQQIHVMWNRYVVGLGRKGIYYTLLPLICNCLQVFTGVFMQLLISVCLLPLALLHYSIHPRVFCCPIFSLLFHSGNRLTRSKLELQLMWHTFLYSLVGYCLGNVWNSTSTVSACMCMGVHVCACVRTHVASWELCFHCPVNGLQYFCSSEIP